MALLAFLGLFFWGVAAGIDWEGRARKGVLSEPTCSATCRWVGLFHPEFGAAGCWVPLRRHKVRRHKARRHKARRPAGASCVCFELPSDTHVAHCSYATAAGQDEHRLCSSTLLLFLKTAGQDFRAHAARGPQGGHCQTKNLALLHCLLLHCALPWVGRRVQWPLLLALLAPRRCVCPSHGCRLADQQPPCLPAASVLRQVVIATNIAETSLTIDGIKVSPQLDLALSAPALALHGPALALHGPALASHGLA